MQALSDQVFADTGLTEHEHGQVGGGKPARLRYEFFGPLESLQAA